MFKSAIRVVVVALNLSAIETHYVLGASESESMQFFEEEAKVITASRRAQDARTVPNGVTVFTADDISRTGARTLADLLRLVPGIDVRYGTNKTNISTINIDARGLIGSSGVGNNHILLLIDGRPTNEYWFGQFQADERLALNNIKKIEVIVGPASPLYGTNAMDAVIQIFTKSAKDLAGAHVAESVGSFNTYSSEAEYGHTFGNGKTSTFMSGRYYQSKGPHIINNNEATYAGNAFFKLNHGPLDISMGYDHGSFQVSQITATTGVTLSRYSLIESDDYYMNASAPIDVTDSVKITPRFYYTYDHQNSNFVFNELNQYRVGGEIQADWSIREGYNLVSGMQVRDNWASVTSAGVHDASERGYFGQLEMRAIPNLYLLAGARLDDTSTSAAFFSPRAGLAYMFDDYWTFKSSFGKAFRTPNLSEFFSPGTISSGVALKPESMQTFESRLEFKSGLKHSASVTYFNSFVRNFISSRGNPPKLVIFNGGSASIWGVETEARERPTSWLTLYGNYSYQETGNNSITSKGTGVASNVQGDLVYAPQSKFNVGFTLQPTHRLTWDLSSEWVDVRRYGFSTLANLPPYYFINTNVRVQILDNLNAHLTVDNLSNKTHQESFQVIMPGRFFLGGLDYKF